MDLNDLKAAINRKTKAVVINNPSNPCGKKIRSNHSCAYHLVLGAVYSAEHLQQIIDVCEQYRIPIIADEIYADMVC